MSSGSLAVLPMAVTMMAGPQIVSDVILVTSQKPIRNSLAFIAAVTSAATSMTFFLMLIATKIGLKGSQSNPSTFELILRYGFVALLVYLAIDAYRGRHEAKQPKWMTSLQNATEREAFRIGFMLIFLMPSDLAVMFAVANYLVANGHSLAGAIPFLLATTTIAALPLLTYLLGGHWAQQKMPKIRDWMNTNSWIINIVVYIFFIVLLLA